MLLHVKKFHPLSGGIVIFSFSASMFRTSCMYFSGKHVFDCLLSPVFPKFFVKSAPVLHENCAPVAY